MSNGPGEETEQAGHGEHSDMELKEKLEASKQLSDRYEKLLAEEKTYRQELQKLFDNKSKEAEQCSQRLGEQCGRLDARLEQLGREFGEQLRALEQKLAQAADAGAQRQQAYEALAQRYGKLVGFQRKIAASLREDNISLPQTVDELQFECLKLREQLIETSAAKEHLEEENASTIEALKSELETSGPLLRGVGSPDSGEVRQMIEDLEKRLEESQAQSAAMAKSLEEYRQRCAQLQVELDTSETVQKDFVRLSQNLQIQLEKIRQAEQEVRWQFAEDVSACNGCESDLRRQTKLNCMHCGKIFCAACVKHQVPTGPANRPTRVCSVCHTLLNRNSAPFFSNTFSSRS